MLEEIDLGKRKALVKALFTGSAISIGVIGLSGFANAVPSKYWRDDDGTLTDLNTNTSGLVPYVGASSNVDIGIYDISATDGLFSGDITTKQVIAVGSSAIVYSGDFISTVTINGRVTTYTNDGTNYTSWTDGTNTWTPTYNVTTGLLEGVAVT